MRYCLIADDNPAMRKVMRGFLTELGFEVSEVTNGREALDSCSARVPDAVLLDWNMPLMDGLGFLDALQAGGPGARPKVIFCTSGVEAAPVIRAMSAGASEYLVKPFDKQSLKSKFALLGLS